MHHRSGRVLAAAAAAAAATAVTAALATSPAATAAPAATANPTTGSPSGNHSFSRFSGQGAFASPKTSTRMAARYGNYPLDVRTLTSKVVMPLQLSVSNRYGVLVGDSGASKLLQVRRGGNVRTVAGGPRGGDVAGVDVNAHGDIAYTSTDYKTGKAGLTIRSHGKSRFVDLSAIERNYNPDKNIRYGTTTTDPCVLDALKKAQFPVSYRGLTDSHPYAVAAVRGGWVVADAGGNDLLLVDAKGHVRVLAVLPAQPHKITAADAKALGAPDCVVGVVYGFEAVPTDVEVSHGALYISTLPGGPEAPGFSPRGSVYRLTLLSHQLRRLATGFDGATNLAITPSGRILVAELYAGRVSTVEHGRPSGVINLPGVASLEFHGHALYAGQTPPTDDKGNPTGPGKVVSVSVRW